jgi:hypothetical protein
MESMSGVLRRLKIRALVIIASQLIKPSHFGSLWGGSFSMDYFFILGSIIFTPFLTFIIINLQIYRIILPPLTTSTNLCPKL